MAHASVDPSQSSADAAGWAYPEPSVRPGAWLRAQLLLERERWVLWLPVAMGTGAAWYYALTVEPPLWLAVAPALLTMVAIALWLSSASPRPVLAAAIGMVAFSAGFASAQLRTALVEAPALAERGIYQVRGTVALVEQRPSGLRLTIDQPILSGVSAAATPPRVRFTVRGEPAVHPGDRIAARAVLIPPSGPAAPGDFDFARYAFFRELGAVGYTLGGLDRITRAEERSVAQRLAGLRQEIARSVTMAVDGAPGAVAAALLTGLRGAIPDPVWDDMQRAGIAHLLAISGLHLGLVAGTLFFASRILITLVPPLALRCHGKKVAAAVALAGALIYLLLTGMTVPTQRAFIMTALALVAIMVDRNPFSMRLVAIAAVFVLAAQPDAILGASFQMSFAAVVGLIAAYETGIGRRPDGAGGLGWALGLYLLGVALTTVIASAATAPFAVYHFGRLPAYGIIANLVAVPVTAFWIMPMGLLGLILLPLGLGTVGFVPMGWGVEVVLDIAGRVADLRYASIELAKPPSVALLAMVGGGLWLCLWRRPWRLLGVIAIVAGLMIAMRAQPPDVLIDETGTLAAVRLDGGRIAHAPWGKDRWVERGWRRRLGATETVPWPEPGERLGPLSCSDAGCRLTRRGRTLVFAEREQALGNGCTGVDIVIARSPTGTCPAAIMVDGDALAAAQGLAIRLRAWGIRLESGRDRRGVRPWTR